MQERKKQWLGGKLFIIDRLRNTASGNPQYHLGLLPPGEQGDLVLFKTRPNSPFSFTIRNFEKKQVRISISSARGKYMQLNDIALHKPMEFLK